jgi:hypothetical protein
MQLNNQTNLPMPTESVVPQVVVITILMLLAVFGNMMMFVSVYSVSNLQTVTNMFTINLAITDFSVGLLILPILITSIVYNRLMFPKELCHFIAFLTVVLLLVSISTLAGISIDRYFCICHPLTYPLKVTTQRVIVVLGVIWLLGILLASGPFYNWGKYQFQPIALPMCSPTWDEYASYASVVTIIGLVMPLGFMIFSYARIIQVARKQARMIADIQMQFGQGDDKPAIAVTGPEPTDEKSCSVVNTCDNKPCSSVRKKSTLKQNLKTLKTVFFVIGKSINHPKVNFFHSTIFKGHYSSLYLEAPMT